MAIKAPPSPEQVLAKLTAKLMSKGIGPSIDHLSELREQKRELEAKVKVIEAEYAAIEAALMSQLDDQGMAKATGTKATASISVTVVGNLVDPEKLHDFIKKTGYFHLLQPRLSDPACRELFEAKGDKAIPGVEPFHRKRLNLRALS